MATGGPPHGYPREIFREDLDPRLICDICQNVLMQPVQTSCGHLFCRACVYGEISTKESPRCPKCELENGDTQFDPDQIHPDRAVEREMYKLKTVCMCGWQGTLKELEQSHWTTCYQKQTTAIQAQYPDTVSEETASDQSEQVSNQDALTALGLQVEELINELLKLQKWLQTLHNNMSSLTRSANREWRALIQRLARLETNQQLFAEALTTQNTNTQQDCPSFDGTLLWKIDGYWSKKEMAVNGSHIKVMSPAFYTSHNGYKLQACIYLNGDGMGRGTHLSVFLVVCKGPTDALLKWPFQQKVTFKLFNQSNGQHIVSSFMSDPNSRSFQRPATAENTASGMPMFALQAVVEKDFIRQDAMFLLITIDLRGLQDPAKSC